MSMVERVAIAIWDERCRHWGKYRKHLYEPNSEGYNWEDLGFSKRKELLREARAAIEALMEPDETMISAYFEKCAELGFTAHITATSAWRTMLTAALGETDE